MWERKKVPYARAHLGRCGVAKYAGAHNVRRNLASPLQERDFFFAVLFFGYLANKFTSRFPNLITDLITTRGRGRSYIYNLSAFTKNNIISVRVLPILTVAPPL